MLYNPQWENQNRKPCLDDLIAWLERQDPAQTYNYGNSTMCLAAQYNDSLCRIYEIPFPFFQAFGNFDKQLEKIALHGWSTFGAALQRAKRMRASRFRQLFL